jgi:hypothetical protein
MPLSIMESRNWKCPHCRRVCNTGHCRRDPRQDPYEPKGTLLGHDTKKVADPRSVECLVDFSVSNLNWLREEEGSDQNALQRRLQQAEMDKLADPSLDPRYADEDLAYAREGIAYSPVEDTTGNLHENGNGHHADAHDGVESYYADPNVNGEIPRLGQKRDRGDEEEEFTGRRKKKAKKQKKKKDDAVPLEPKNVSGQQYQKEIQRKLLEEAKKEDRFVLVAARMKNKSKFVKLSLRAGLLQQIRERPEPDRPQVVRQSTPEDVNVNGTSGMGSILQSDVMQKAATPKNLVEKEKAAKTFRIRVQEDEAYSTRKRNTDGAGPSKPSGTRGNRRYEEITLDSDEEFGDEDGDVEYTGRSQGRASNWLARKNEGEEDLPAELPPDFRDGVIRPGRGKDLERARERNERRKTMPPKPKAGFRPPGRPPKPANRRSTGDLPGHASEDGVHKEVGVHEEDDQLNEAQSVEALLLAQQAAAAALAAQKREEEASAEQARVEAAEREAQENLRAKMALFERSDDGGAGVIDDFLGGLSGGEEFEEPIKISPPPPPNNPSPSPDFYSEPEPARTGPPPTINSRFAQPGMRGKKIKIVSAQSRSNANGITTTMASSSFTPVNRRGKEIDLSDSDSEDEVPASAPVVKKPLGRPIMVPTRGRGAKRGRGRPRKTM